MEPGHQRIPFDDNRKPFLAGLSSLDGQTSVPLYADSSTHALLVSATLSTTSSTAINDGATPSIKATVANLTNAKALAVEVVDGSGNQITSFGGGTQYTDGGATVVHPIGTMPVYDNAGTISKVGTSNGLPVQGVGNFNVLGTKTNNNAAPGANNIGALVGIANAAAPSYTEGDQVLLSTDLAGSLRITGSISVGGTTDNSAYTAGTSTGTPAMGFYHSTIDTVTDGRAATVAITSKRAMMVNLQNSSGTEIGTSANPVNTAVVNQDLIDANNSSTATLLANATFTGTGTATANYSYIQVYVYSDQSSAASGVKIEFSSDNTNWNDSSNFAFTAGGSAPNDGQTYGAPVRAAYYRVVYTNGAVNQTAFRLQAILKDHASPGDMVTMSTVPNSTNHAQLTKSSIVGLTTGGGGGFVDVKVNPSGTLTVDASNSTGIVLGAGTAAIGGITGAGSNAQIKDDTFYGDGVTSGILSVTGRLWNGTSYDRWHGDTTNGAWVNVKTSVLPTNAAIETGGNLASIATNTTNIPNVIGTAAAAIPSKLLQIGGSDGTNARAIKTNASGQLDIRPLTSSDNVTVANATLAVTQSGNWTSRIVGNAGATLDSTIGAGTAPTNQVVTGAVYNSTEISPTTGQAFAIQADSKGRQRTVLMDGAGNTRAVNVTAGNAMQSDLTSIAGNAVSAGNGTSGTGVQRVTVASDSTGQIAVAANATATGLSFNYQSALTSTKVQIKGTAGNLHGWHIYNPNNAVTYIQIFNKASASVTVGTTAPDMVIVVPQQGWLDDMPAMPITMGTGITIAATTTASGSTAPTNTLISNFWYI